MSCVHVFTSKERFVQYLASNLLPHGYWFYTAGVIPAPKDPKKTDAKLREQYDLTASRHKRVEMKHEGVARVKYLRFRRSFVLVGTWGRHPFLTEEANLLDIRERPLKFWGYSIGYYFCEKDGKWHSSVRIELAEEKRLKEKYLEEAARSLSWWKWRWKHFPYRGYVRRISKPIIQQKWEIWAAVNEERKRLGLPVVPKELMLLKKD